jgi:D-beta-D-heptose 7-phosphate kinase/D-beta-D-heptose 1-phosphate adenosyltransferase
VLANICGLGGQADIISLVGDDHEGRQVESAIEGMGIHADGLLRDSARPTTLKTRYLSQNQQLLRVDHEQVQPLSSENETLLFEKADALIANAEVLVLSDYGKGFLSPAIVKKLIKLAAKNKIPVIVDPKSKDFSIYKGADLITPNRKELSDATGGMAVETDEDIEKAAQYLIKHNGLKTVIATRSEDGVSVISKKDTPLHLRTNALEVFDVSGAGDTVVAAIAVSLAAGGTVDQAAQIANVAGGLAVAKVGTAVVRAAEIIDSFGQEGSDEEGNIAPVYQEWTAAREKIQQWQAQGFKVGFTNGCFDIVHYGHVHYLNEASKKCDRLVLGINTDVSVHILKGPDRPVNDQNARAAVMAGLSSIDMVVFFGAEKEGEDNTPCNLIEALKPDIFMKGGDYTIDQLPEAKVVQSYRGQVEIMPLYEGYSTTNIIEKSKKNVA